MDNDAGHKRKEFTQKFKSSIKKWWHNWFGDIKFLRKLIYHKRIIVPTILLSVIANGLILGFTTPSFWDDIVPIDGGLILLIVPVFIYLFFKIIFGIKDN